MTKLFKSLYFLCMTLDTPKSLLLLFPSLRLVLVVWGFFMSSIEFWCHQKSVKDDKKEFTLVHKEICPLR